MKEKAEEKDKQEVLQVEVEMGLIKVDPLR